MEKQKNILVAGGSGFIGSHLCDHLLSLGHKVTAIDSLITGRMDNISHIDKNDNFNFIKHDIRVDLPELGDLDQIYNLASPASPKDFASIGDYILETSCIGHRNLLFLAKEKTARILFASTSEVYGDPLVHPQPESYFGNVNTLGERACYDEAKRFGETLSVVMAQKHQIDVRIARIFNTYGPRMAPDDGRILPNFFTQALNNQPLTIYGQGQQTRSFCFVTDMVRALYALMNSKENMPTNLGNPIERSVQDIANEVNRLTGNTAGCTSRPLPENDPKMRRPDISKAKKVLSWEPVVGLEEGLEKTFAYFKSLHLKSSSKQDHETQL